MPAAEAIVIATHEEFTTLEAPIVCTWGVEAPTNDYFVAANGVVAKDSAFIRLGIRRTHETESTTQNCGSYRCFTKYRLQKIREHFVPPGRLQDCSRVAPHVNSNTLWRQMLRGLKNGLFEVVKKQEERDSIRPRS
jgi:hypothetical protein